MARLVTDAVAELDRGEDFIDVDQSQRPVYGIIATQSCDLAEERPDPRQPWLAVAPAFWSAPTASLHHRDYISPLAPPTLTGEPQVADRRIEMPLEKGLLVRRVPIEVFPDEDGYIDVANFLARRRGAQHSPASSTKYLARPRSASRSSTRLTVALLGRRARTSMGG